MGKITQITGPSQLLRSLLISESETLTKPGLERIGITWYAGAPDVFPRDGRRAGVAGYQGMPANGVLSLLQHKPAAGSWTGHQATPDYIAHLAHGEVAVLDIYSFRVAAQTAYLKPSSTNDGGFYHYKIYLRFNSAGVRQYQKVHITLNNNGGDREQGNWNLSNATDKFVKDGWHDWPSAQWGDPADWARIHEVVVTNGRGWVAAIRFAPDGGIEIGGQRDGGEPAETMTVLCPQVKIFSNSDSYSGSENGDIEELTKPFIPGGAFTKKLMKITSGNKVLTFIANTLAKQWLPENKNSATVISEIITYKNKKYQLTVNLPGAHVVCVNDDDVNNGGNALPAGYHYAAKDWYVAGLITEQSNASSPTTPVSTATLTAIDAATQAELNEVKSKFNLSFQYTAAFSGWGSPTSVDQWIALGFQHSTTAMGARVNKPVSYNLFPTTRQEADRNLWYGDVENKIILQNGTISIWSYIKDNSGEQGAVAGATDIKVVFTP